MRRLTAMLLTGALLGLAGRAGASPTTRLVYVRSDGGEACPDEESLRQSVMGHLGYDPFRPYAEATLFAEVHRQGERFVGSVKMLDARGIERGARTLEGHGADCDELMAAVALSISIAIDPRMALRGPSVEAPVGGDGASSEVASDLSEGDGRGLEETSTAEPTVSAAEAVRAAAPENAPSPRLKTSAAMRLAIGGGVYVAVGEGPSPSPGVRIAAEMVHRGKLSAAIELRAGLPTSSAITGGVVRTSLLGGALVPCWRAWRFSACAVAFVGRMATATEDVPRPSSRAFVHVAAGLRAALDIPLSDALAFRVGADGMATVAPFVVEVDNRAVYESSAVTGLVGASLVRAF
jgi:hypothetical protein